MDVVTNLKDLKNSLNMSTVTTGMIAAIFGCTGPVLVLINAALKANLDWDQMVSWLSSIYIMGGAVGIFLSLKYKQPISGAWSIPSAIFLGTMLTRYTINEAVGAYIISGMIIVILGILGLGSIMIKWLPLPIVMGMVAGSMISFGTNIVNSLRTLPLLSLVTLIGYFVFAKLFNKIPSILGAIIFGLAVVIFKSQIDLSNITYSLTYPMIITPQFTAKSIFSISIPVVVLAIGVNNAQGIGVLVSQGYRPPIDTITIVTGIASIIVAPFGGHGVTIAGPKTAICASTSAGKNKEHRYASAFVDGFIFIIFGLFIAVALAFINLFPKEIIEIIAGLAMVNVLIEAFQIAFSAKKFQVGTFFALIIAMSDFSIFGISAPFWALFCGTIISVIIEKDDFRSGEYKVENF